MPPERFSVYSPEMPMGLPDSVRWFTGHMGQPGEELVESYER
jgi:hypothetical protein